MELYRTKKKKDVALVRERTAASLLSLPTFADRECRVVSAAGPYFRMFELLDREHGIIQRNEKQN
jgi:hypothetical protein